MRNIPIQKESINDKHIFKAVFLAGGAGSGKSFITSKVFGYDGRTAVSPMGVKILNSDFFFERFLKKSGLPFVIDLADEETYAKQSIERARAKDKVELQKAFFLDGMLPIIIDGTGKDVDKILLTKQELEDFGYDCSMIFVNTSLEVALERNANRDRKVDPSIATKMWHEVQNNIGIFQREFENNDFYIIDNSEILSDKELEDFELYLFKLGEKILKKPLYNPIGKGIIRQLQLKKGRYISDLIESKKNTTMNKKLVNESNRLEKELGVYIRRQKFKDGSFGLIATIDDFDITIGLEFDPYDSEYEMYPRYFWSSYSKLRVEGKTLTEVVQKLCKIVMQKNERSLSLDRKCKNLWQSNRYSESSSDIEAIADIVRNNNVPLLQLRSSLEKLFPKKAIDFSFTGAPHYTITTKKGKIMIVNKKYVDDADIIVNDIAIGYM